MQFIPVYPVSKIFIWVQDCKENEAEVILGQLESREQKMGQEGEWKFVQKADTTQYLRLSSQIEPGMTKSRESQCLILFTSRTRAKRGTTTINLIHSQTEIPNF